MALQICNQGGGERASTMPKDKSKFFEKNRQLALYLSNIFARESKDLHQSLNGLEPNEKETNPKRKSK